MSILCPRCEHENDAKARFCVSCGLRVSERPPREDSGTALAPGAAPVPIPSSGSSAAHEAAPAPAPKQARRDPLIGKEIEGRYHITAVIGEGGMGKVYRAQQKMGNATRNVAIKVLHPERGRDPQLAARFQRECETVIQLHHPNTVQFFDFGEMEDGTLFIVMEYIDGEPLSDVIDRGTLTPERTEHLLEQICGSLQEAHDRGIVHRDLKPDNVLLTNVGGTSDFVKVLDFGIAKQHGGTHDDGKSLTQHGVIIGTPPYMSPEQFSSKPLGPQSDVYSLGVMAYEMLTGRLPFDAKTPWEWAAHHMNSEPISLDDHVAGSMIATTRKTAIMRALNKKPEQRHESVTKFLNEFRVGPPHTSAPPSAAPAPVSAAASAPAEPISATQQAEQAVHRRRGLPWWAWTMLGIGLLIAGVGIGLAALKPDKPAPATIIYEAPSRGPSAPAEPNPTPTKTPPKAKREAPTKRPARNAKPTPKGSTKTSARGTERAKRRPAPATTTTRPEPAKAEPTAPTSAPKSAPTDTAPAPKPTPSSTRKTSPTPEPTPAAPPPATSLRGEELVSAARSAIRQGNISLAVTRYKQALAQLGPKHKSITRLARRLSKAGRTGVGTYIRRGQCKDAQRLYRELSSVGLGKPATSQFDDRICRQP